MMSLKMPFISTLTSTVNKVSPRPSIAPDSDAANSAETMSQQAQSTQQSSSGTSKPEPGKAPSRAGACRVCLKSFKPDEFSKICFECQQKVCEDCASYSKLEDNEDAVCHRFRFFISLFELFLIIVCVR